MAIYKLGQETKKETIEDRLNRAINLGRREAYKEVLEWLDENFYDSTDDLSVQSHFDFKDRMLQSFKEHFNIE